MHTQPKVLVVDDEPMVCSLIQEELLRYGIECRIVSDPRQAASLIETREFSVMIADITMPHVSGLELLLHARRYAPECKVILITGHSIREYLAKAITLGAYDYVEKPFRARVLGPMVYRAMAGDDSVPHLSARAAAAMEKGEQAQASAFEAVRALVLAVEAKDTYTKQHSEQVAHYALNLAQSLSLPMNMANRIRIAALLHDIGKIGVPDHVLTKPEALTPEEFAYIRRHPALGSEILASITVFEQEALLVRHHHERWDGQGYPDGLIGDEIPLGSRIIQVADCMDAMLMERTYKGGHSVDKMLHELVRCAGTQFDYKVAAAGVAWCRMHPGELILPGRTVQMTPNVWRDPHLLPQTAHSL